MKNRLAQALLMAGSNVSLWWGGRSRRTRIGVITAGIAVVVISVLAVAGWVNPSLTGGAASNQISATLPTAYPSVSVAPTPGVSNKVDASTGLKVNFQIDSDGMVVMPVTTNPREAAAAAAAIMYSVDMTMVKDAIDYREKAIARMTIPSPEYVGPYPQVQLYSGREVKPGEFVPAFEAMVGAVNYLAPSSGVRQSGYWRGESWTLMFPDVYAGMVTAGTRWVAKPVQVLNFAEMKALNPGNGWNSFQKFHFLTSEYRPADFTPDEPGASFDEYYVQLSVDKYSGAGEISTQIATVAMWVWCDAPDKGGLCGVGMIDPIDWRLNWPRLQ